MLSLSRLFAMQIYEKIANLIFNADLLKVFLKFNIVKSYNMITYNTCIKLGSLILVKKQSVENNCDNSVDIIPSSNRPCK